MACNKRLFPLPKSKPADVRCQKTTGSVHQRKKKKGRRWNARSLSKIDRDSIRLQSAHSLKQKAAANVKEKEKAKKIPAAGYFAMPGKDFSSDQRLQERTKQKRRKEERRNRGVCVVQVLGNQDFLNCFLQNADKYV